MWYNVVKDICARCIGDEIASMVQSVSVFTVNCFLARPLNLAAISALRSGVLHLPGVSEIVFLNKPRKLTEELIIG